MMHVYVEIKQAKEGYYLSIFYTIVACEVFPCVSLILFIVLPESPVYLMMKDKIEKAHMPLQRLRDKEFSGTIMFYTMDIFDKSKGGMSAKNCSAIGGDYAFHCFFHCNLSYESCFLHIGTRRRISQPHFMDAGVLLLLICRGVFIWFGTMAEVFSQDVKGFTVAVFCTISWLASFVNHGSVEFCWGDENNSIYYKDVEGPWFACNNL
uniref:Major facilitator superfamily (MFS) profile domain-containing protein n=1 Tax=Glossina palpalis gambiensis TaxID=67801 RepID=A0A1B0BNJ4_9MUSC